MANTNNTMKDLDIPREGGSLPLKALMVALLLLGILSISNAQMLVDGFNRANSNVVGSGWTEFESGGAAGVRIESNRLRMNGTGVAGREYVSQPVSSNYNTVLNSNAFLLEWSFNMRQSAGNPTGFFDNRIGAGVVLAGSQADLQNGVGYAVVIGSNASTVNPLRLVRYTGGVKGTFTDVISVGDVNHHYMDVRVTFDPFTGTWTMYHTDNGPSGPFGDPTMAVTFGGSAVNTTHTGTNLPYIGCLFNHGGSTTPHAWFDNFRVPQDLSTSVSLLSTTASIGGMDGSHTITVAIDNPDPDDPVSVDLVLVSGDAARLQGFSSQTVTFPANTGGTMDVVVDIVENGACIGNEVFVFALQNLVGGIGTPHIGFAGQQQLTVTDDRSQPRVVLVESFETDGSGDRYTVSAPHGTGPSGAFFLRADAFGFSSAGTLVPTNMNGNYAMGGNNMTTLAANSEVVVAFPSVDILGVSNINMGMRVAARNASTYDNRNDRVDYLYAEVNVDGQGWTTVGAFRSKANVGFDNKPFAQDTDFDGVGDGANLGPNMTSFSFPVPQTGTAMEVRVRFRSNDVSEEIFFDHIQVAGTLCRPVHFSTGNGDITDPIWSNLRNGAPNAVNVDRHASFVVQEGHQVLASNDHEILDLTVESNALFAFDDRTITLGGEQITVDGALTATTGTLHLVGDDALTFNGGGTVDLHHVTVDRPDGIVLSAAMDVRGTLQINEGVLNAQSGIRLVSNAAGTARLGPVGAAADLVGNTTMQRWIPGGVTNWRLIGSPVQGATVSDWNDDFFTAGFPGSNYPNFYSNNELWPSIRWYDETQPGPDMNIGLVGVTGLAQVLNVGQGFGAWSGDFQGGTQPFTIDVTGTANIAHAPIQLPMSWTNSGNPGADGYNLVSNPLPSAIDFAVVDRGADVSNFYWVYDPISGNNATWNGVVGINGANGILQSSQAFWLKANGPAVTTTIGEAAKVDNNSGGFFGGLMLQEPLPMLRLQVSGGQHGFSDEAVVVFEQGASIAKFAFGHPDAPRIATHDQAGGPLAINMYGMPDAAITIPVHVKVPAQGSFTLNVSGIEALAGISCVMIEDLVTGTSTILTEGTLIPFTAEQAQGEVAPRFLIHVSAPVQRTVTDATCFGANDGMIGLHLPEGETMVSLLDSHGQLIAQEITDAVTFTGLAAGNYMTRVASSAGCGDLTAAVTIREPMALEAELVSTAADCGTDNGSLVPTIFGGTAPFTYTWSNGTTEPQLVAATGAYGLSIADAHGCTWTATELAIGEQRTPTAAFSVEQEVVAPHDPVHFTYEGSTADAILWDLGDGTFSEEINPVHSYTELGSYMVTLSVEQGNCYSQALGQVVVQTSTGIRQMEESSFTVYCDGVQFVLEHQFSGGDVLHVEVLDATGKLHVQQTNSDGPGRLLVPAHTLPNGIWFVRLTHQGVQQTQRVPLMR